MTLRLYNQDATIHMFLAEVTSCSQREDALYQITLDQTAFFPTGGGQGADTGVFMLGEDVIPVTDVIEHKEEVFHVTKKPLKPGVKITGLLDWEKRFSKMQQHTGEHIVSGLVHRLYGYENVGFHLGEEAVTMDLNGLLDRDQLAQIERLANAVIGENLAVEVLYPTEVELEKLQYRSKMEIEGQVRVVQIPLCDSCACCAPHVPRTGGVGMIKILRAQKHRGGMRLSLACGDRALKDYQMKSANIKAISALLSVKEEDAAVGVTKLNQELQDTKYKLLQQWDEMVHLKLELLKAKGGIEAQELCILFEEGFHADQGRVMVSKVLDFCPSGVVVFTPKGEEEYEFVAGIKEGDLRYIAQELGTAFGAKGGGKATMVQGSVRASKAEIIAVLRGE